VVVKTRDGEVMVKELRRHTSKSIELRSVDRDVLWMHRVVWASQ
jgi:phage repressor protein C with HTH and peptisase S24 domain